ncbi:MAG: Phosphate acyltransferase [Ignavibacteria bacterium]|nr:Phosphate acyltransferase [Ignavibacteria bacterium]
MAKNNRKFRIALDAMGSDYAPESEVRGAILAFEALKNEIDIEIIYAGNETEINKILTGITPRDFKYSILHADEVVTMDDEPTVALKRKRNSSMFKGLELQAQGNADAFVSAGNTGAVLATSTVVLGKIEGVSRPTIGAFLPSREGTPVLVVDVGANVECKPKFLYEFAVMGSICANEVLGIKNPKVGLLNIGEEETKGNELTLATYPLLKNSNLNFIGNVEGRDVLKGEANVVVCDGFVGNIVLKFAESMPIFFKAQFEHHQVTGLYQNLKLRAAQSTLREVSLPLDSQESGGVPLLGVAGNVIIGHGNSTPKAIKSMIMQAVTLIQNEINKKIESALKQTDDSKQS